MRCIATRTRTAAVVSFSPLLRALREPRVRPDPLAVRPLPRVRVTWVEVVDPECRFDLDAMQVKGYDLLVSSSEHRDVRRRLAALRGVCFDVLAAGLALRPLPLPMNLDRSYFTALLSNIRFGKSFFSPFHFFVVLLVHSRTLSASLIESLESSQRKARERGKFLNYSQFHFYCSSRCCSLSPGEPHGNSIFFLSVITLLFKFFFVLIFRPLIMHLSTLKLTHAYDRNLKSR